MSNLFLCNPLVPEALASVQTTRIILNAQSLDDSLPTQNLCILTWQTIQVDIKA